MILVGTYFFNGKDLDAYFYGEFIFAYCIMTVVYVSTLVDMFKNKQRLPSVRIGDEFKFMVI